MLDVRRVMNAGHMIVCEPNIVRYWTLVILSLDRVVCRQLQKIDISSNMETIHGYESDGIYIRGLGLQKFETLITGKHSIKA